MQGVSWFGQEGPGRLPYGLWERGLASIMGFLADNNFNTVRIFLSMQNVYENKPTPRHFDEDESPQLVGTDFLGLLRAITREAAKHSILVLLANRQIRNGYPESWPGTWDGNWFDEEYQPDRILSVWSTLAKALCTEWNIMGVE